MNGYIKEKKTGNVTSYFDLDNIPEDTMEYEFTACSSDKLPAIHKEPISKEQEANVLISNKMRQMAEDALISEGKIERKNGKLIKK